MSLTLTKNDRRARALILSTSVIVFVAVVVLGRVKLDVNLGFDAHVFAKANAVINTTVAVLLVAGLVTVKRRQYATHKRLMLTAMVLSFSTLR